MSTPLELAQAPRWVCWRLEPDPKGGKPRNVPYDPKSGRRASSTSPETWTDMATAQAAQAKYAYIETKAVRMGGDLRKAVVLNYEEIQRRCDVSQHLR